MTETKPAEGASHPKDILFLPGYACTSQIWLPVLSYLDPDFSPTLVDWPITITPGFEHISEFSHWLDSQYDMQSFNLIIGHSMGGLAAIQWQLDHPSKHVDLILIESFIRPPGPFFQNLLMPDTPPALSQQVNQMLQSQRVFYADGLQISLRAMDLLQEIQLGNLSIEALYGDRGKPLQAPAALQWPENIARRIPVHFIPNACHFPMVENPRSVAAVICQTAGSAISLDE